MTTPSWTPGTLYAPGAVVQRVTASPVVSQAPVNPGFEDGDVNWTKGTGWTIGEYVANFDGSWTGRSRDAIGTNRIYTTAAVPVIPGLTLTASCQCRRGEDGMSGRVQLEWLTSGSVSIRIDNGNLIDSGVDKWKQSTVTGTAPATAVFVRVGATVTQNHNGRNFYVDAFQWNYAYSAPIDSLVFTATQAAPGYSGGTEPAWPTVLGGTVVDNEVTWEAIDSSTVTWEAAPILVSGPNEPGFPIETGGTVADNTIIWTAIPRIVSDEKCPHSKVVAIAASKIFAADNDIIAYSATVNPLDWSTPDDAGYLPFGLQTHGANPVAAMGLYRSNLVAFNSTGFQMWQVDPDPQQMALLDAAPVGCRYYLSIKPFQNDLAFLSEVGIRNISIAGASTNLEAGVFGKPVDPLVKEKVNEAGFEPFSMFVPTLGQFWMTWGPESLVMTTTGLKQMSWSRYVFPEDLDCMTIQTGDLYIRTADHHIWRLDGDETADDVYCQPTPPVLFGEAYGLTVELQWYESEFETPIVAYLVLRSVDGSLFVEIGQTPGDVLTYTDVTVESGHVYRYIVIAHPDSTGIDSEPSNEVEFEFVTTIAPGDSEASSAPPSTIVYEVDDEWVKPPELVSIDVICIGGGGGGGGGGLGSAQYIIGGQGGGGGGYSVLNILAGDLAATETVTVGASGASSGVLTAFTSNGLDGGAGGTSSFGAHLTAHGGGGGAKGYYGPSGVTYPNGGIGTTYNGGRGGAGGVSGANNSGHGCGSGGGGGGTNTNAYYVTQPGAGAASPEGGTTGAAGVSIQSPNPTPTNGSSPSPLVNTYRGGGGGGGGSAIKYPYAPTTVAAHGAAGTKYGGGGGGGGAATSFGSPKSSAGAGGVGGQGVVVVVHHYS